MDKVGDPCRCERSEWATENEKFTVLEEILNFLVMGVIFQSPVLKIELENLSPTVFVQSP